MCGHKVTDLAMAHACENADRATPKKPTRIRPVDRVIPGVGVGRARLVYQWVDAQELTGSGVVVAIDSVLGGLSARTKTKLVRPQ
jgi:hypothetical protein